jgi:hypothetical protein
MILKPSSGSTGKGAMFNKPLRLEVEEWKRGPNAIFPTLNSFPNLKIN